MSKRVRGRARICILGLRGFPGVMGGVETHCEALYPRLAQLLNADFIVLGRKGYVAAQKFEGIDITPIWAPRSKYFEAIVHTLLALLYARFACKSDVVHIHAIGPALLSPLARLLGMRVIVTHHGCDYARAKWNGLARAVLRAGEWISIYAADRIIVVSMNVADALRAAHPYAAKRIVHIPNGADPSTVAARDEALLEHFGLTAHKYVLAVGRLVPEKGFHELVQAFRASKIDAKLVIAGGADHQDRYAQRLQACGGEDVVFTGRVGRAELGTLYSKTSLFVLPSHHEGLAIAALEAVAAGAPVLVSDIAANKDLALGEENYFPVGQVEALKRKLSRSHERYRVDRAQLLARFDWCTIAEQSSDVYAGVAPHAAKAQLAGSGSASAMTA
jgi:glycosyltransferase involved in cell wall biosynthesis